MQRTNRLPRRWVSILFTILFAVVAVGCSGYSVAAPMSPELLALSAELRETPRVAAGRGFVLAVKDGKIYGWGTNEAVLIDENGGQPSWNDPVVIPISDNIVSVSAGVEHAIALTKNGDVWTWGNNYFGSLGVIQSSDKEHRPSWSSDVWKAEPFKVKGLPKIVKISAGTSHNLALTASSNVWAWGGNKSGQSGELPLSFVSMPHLVEGLSEIANIFAGASSSFAITEKNKYYMWGANYNNNIPTTVDLIKVAHPIEINESICGYESIIYANFYISSVFVCKDGRVAVIGKNGTGLLGLGDTEERDSIVFNPYLSSVIKITGGSPRVSLHRNGKIMGWGQSKYGVAEFSSGGKLRPYKVNFPYYAIDIYSNDFNAYVVSGSGLIYKWIPGKSWWVKGLYKFFDGYSFEALKDKDRKDFYLFENGALKGEIK